MRLLLALALVLSICGSAHAQSPLAVALLGRYPTHELVPQSCEPGTDLVAVRAGRICLRDEATGLARVVRRVALVRSDVGATAGRRGTDVVFAVDDPAGDDYGNVTTRLGGRVWHWDLVRDAYIGLANSGGDAFATSFALFYFAGDGNLYRFDPGSPPRVSPRLPAGGWLVVGDATYLARTSATRREVSVFQLTEQSGAFVETPFATVPGHLFAASHGVVVTMVESADPIALHVLRLPATVPTTVTLPAGSRSPRYADWVDRDTLRLTRWHQPTQRLDVRALTVRYETGSDVPPPVLHASSLRAMTPTTTGLFVASSSRGFDLGPSGAAAVRRTTRRAVSSLCTCEDTVLVCGAGTRVTDACTEVPELDRVLDGRSPSTSTLYARGGTMRYDRLEADYVRITRLRDGARLWVRVFGSTLFAQLDDGAYYLSDRSIEPLIALRDGGTLTAGPLVPLASRAAALYRPTLIADFFAAP